MIYIQILFYYSMCIFTLYSMVLFTFFVFTKISLKRKLFSES